MCVLFFFIKNKHFAIILLIIHRRAFMLQDLKVKIFTSDFCRSVWITIDVVSFFL